ncbi:MULTISPECIES: exosortase F system-associated membrane protein [Flavobacterium]|uniref:exosortase F system-associated membrane protein n=1 Tax=Flavobacterium TaxID=237 RepID=UPI0022252230|nr:exosortase F system-associated protein [Flavobacterium sp. N1846]
MLRKKLNRRAQITLFVFLLGLLVSVRAFENEWFYDPFINYFQSEFSHLKYPNYNEVLLFANWIFRYFLNSVFSIAIIYVIFQEMQMVKFSVVLLIIFLIFLLLGMFVLLHFFDEEQKMILFYVRRFLIQPLFLLLFIPGFLYQKKTL